MTMNRSGHTAILLPNGKVLVAGGDSGSGYQPTAEVYDPATGLWTAVGSLSTPRADFCATLLLNGKVLVEGGHNSNGYISAAELFDLGLGFSASSQPVLASATSPFALGGTLVVAGSRFRGSSQSSSGNGQDSPTDYPLVQLRNLENGQTGFLQCTNWHTNAFTSVPVWNFPPGHALATVFVNAIPSTSGVVSITVPAPAMTVLTDVHYLPGGTCQLNFTNTPGACLRMLTATNVALPLANWTAVSGVTEIAPGQFQFTDSSANAPQRFYRLSAP